MHLHILVNGIETSEAALKIAQRSLGLEGNGIFLGLGPRFEVFYGLLGRFFFPCKTIKLPLKGRSELLSLSFSARQARLSASSNLSLTFTSRFS